MTFGVKLFRILALLACVSLVVAGGTWVHHAHNNQQHAHESERLAQLPHAHIHDDADKDAPHLSLVHCGSDHVWFETAWSPPHLVEATALGEAKQFSAIPVYLQVEEPPPRLIVSRA